MFEIKIKNIIEEPLLDLGYNIIRIQLIKNKNIQIMIERQSDGNLDVDDCVFLSRHISTILNVDEGAFKDYSLEISSPGLDRPLIIREDFLRFLGRRVNIKLFNIHDGKSKFSAILSNIDENNIVKFITDRNAEDLELPLDSIKACNLIPEIDFSKKKQN